MDVPENVIDDFINRHRTAAWLRTYFIGRREGNKVPHDADDTTAPLTNQQKMAMLLDSNKSGQLYLSPWEKDFLNENGELEYLSDGQIGIVNKLWKRLTT